ncbi:hypothetical protein OCU04_008177 [Sclerotinia nivalis]|uniref:Uncharacterized protein n=1 Tax=Sclerotinia nivalis TaxID=352851 RepID=A0A9X0AHJ5_9HELO|nr:hypothetical protein OCU04_008177 [Sclerotinia nivalis]
MYHSINMHKGKALILFRKVETQRNLSWCGEFLVPLLDVVVDRDSDVSYEDVYVDMKNKKIKARGDADDTIAYLDVVVDRDSDVSYEDVYVDMKSKMKARSDADDTIAYLDVVADRDSDVSYEDVYVDME